MDGFFFSFFFFAASPAGSAAQCNSPGGTHHRLDGCRAAEHRPVTANAYGPHGSSARGGRQNVAPRTGGLTESWDAAPNESTKVSSTDSGARCDLSFANRVSGLCLWPRSTAGTIAKGYETYPAGVSRRSTVCEGQDVTAVQRRKKSASRRTSQIEPVRFSPWFGWVIDPGR